MSGREPSASRPTRTQPPRLLHRRSERGYTDRIASALALEPEAVDAETQERQSLAARRAERERQRAAWRPVRADLQRARDLLLAQQLTGASNVRVLQRFIDRLDRRIGS